MKEIFCIIQRFQNILRDQDLGIFPVEIRIKEYEKKCEVPTL